jgi:hypothetical protein
MISNFIFSKIFRIVRSDDIGCIIHGRPQMYSKPINGHQLWYVCIEKYNSNNEIIDGFDCMSFDNYKDAQNQKMDLCLCKDQEVGLRKTIVPVCKWTPTIFHSFIIGYKLRNKYWKNIINIYSNSEEKKT